MTFTLDIDIAAPPADVFQFVADFTTTPQWYSAVHRVEPAPTGTHLQLEGSISAAGLPFPARLLSPAAERIFQHGMRDNLGALRRRLEHRP